jgi:hypothetical protein
MVYGLWFMVYGLEVSGLRVLGFGFQVLGWRVVT